jgi:hypothetical protein
MIQASVGRTIHQQLMTLDRRALWAWGSTAMTYIDQGLRFKTSGMVKWKGIVEIKLNGSDLYDIEFYRLRAGKKFFDKLSKDVFCEDLVTFIDEQVG